MAVASAGAAACTSTSLSTRVPARTLAHPIARQVLEYPFVLPAGRKGVRKFNKKWSMSVVMYWMPGCEHCIRMKPMFSACGPNPTPRARTGRCHVAGLPSVQRQLARGSGLSGFVWPSAAAVRVGLGGGGASPARLELMPRCHTKLLRRVRAQWTPLPRRARTVLRRSGMPHSPTLAGQPSTAREHGPHACCKKSPSTRRALRPPPACSLQRHARLDWVLFSHDNVHF